MVETLALAALPVAWLWSAITVLGEAWLWPVAGAVGSMAVAAALVRQAGAPVFGSAAAAIVGFGWVTALTAPEEALLGVVPTPESFPVSMQVLSDGVLAIAWAPSTPIDARGAVLAAVVAAAVMIAAIVDLMAHALRLPAVAVAFAAVPLLLPIAFRIDVPWWHALPGVVATACVLAAPALDERLLARRGWLAPIALVGAAAVLAAAVPLIAPAPRDVDWDLPTLDEVFTPATPVLSTEIDLGDELRRPADRPVFTYSTADGQPMPTRLMTLPQAGESGFEAVTPQAGSPGALVEGAASVEATQMTVRMGAVQAESLPMPERALGARVPEGSSWDDANDALRLSADIDTQGLEYTASGTRSPPLVALPAAGASSGHDAERALPEAAAAIAARGAALVDDGMSATQRVLAVHGAMTSGLWNYSEELDLPGFGGSGGGDGWAALEGFLETRSGYCVHYASATAALLRGAGVPSRVVVGFLPGSEISGGWAVSTNEMHAWAEAWLDDFGWVRVETTPGAGTGAASPTGDVPTRSPEPQPTETEEPVESEEPSPSPTPSATATAPAPTASATPAPQVERGPAIDPALVRGILLALGIALLLALPALVRLAQRRLRLRRGAPGGWHELRATLADLGTRLPASATPGALQAAIAARAPDAAAAADRVRLAAERAVFDAGPREPGVVDDDVRSVRRSLAAASPPWRRAIAVILPPSLLGVVRRSED
ncbi:DUF3488 and transglutaminase-like domain-containing protein [Agrococcus carbonis]|uniref:DUF3488 and transglutaminase-like domain-containing protein n=1 Tax=Agrococcus carbonis TaxID=684552 RepID=UPI0012F73152|nr:transglutaminase domain-containing protein [Agrococcus carbonis]